MAAGPARGFIAFHVQTGFLEAKESRGVARQTDVIRPAKARTLDGLFAARVKRSADAVAYINFDEASGSWKQYTWKDIDKLVARWQAALARESLEGLVRRVVEPCRPARLSRWAGGLRGDG